MSRAVRCVASVVCTSRTTPTTAMIAGSRHMLEIETGRQVSWRKPIQPMRTTMRSAFPMVWSVMDPASLRAFERRNTTPG